MQALFLDCEFTALQLDDTAELLGLGHITESIGGNVDEDNEAWEESCKYLPIIARNCLDNGMSTNLWYEEVLPAQSILIFFVSYDDEDNIERFDQILCNKPVQIGANASIGYGFCNITRLETQKNL